MEGAALLDQLAHTYRRFVSLPEGGAEALALWIVFTYALEAFDVAPILALCSPLKRCGKTTTEEVTTALAQRPLAAPSRISVGGASAAMAAASAGKRRV